VIVDGADAGGFRLTGRDDSGTVTPTICFSIAAILALTPRSARPDGRLERTSTSSRLELASAAPARARGLRGGCGAACRARALRTKSLRRLRSIIAFSSARIGVVELARRDVFFAAPCPARARVPVIERTTRRRMPPSPPSLPLDMG
jgi:hypothetical protein